jgi:hypothetical protein
MHMVISLGDEMSRTDRFGQKVARRFMMRRYTCIMHLMGCLVYVILAIAVYQIYRLGYKGESTVVLHGYESMECNVERFNHLLLDCTRPGSFCYEPKPGVAGGVEEHMQAMRDNFRRACTDSNDIWLLIAQQKEAQALSQLPPVGMDSIKSTHLATVYSPPPSSGFDFVGTPAGGGVDNRTWYNYGLKIESGSVAKGCSVESIGEIVFIACCGVFSVFVAAAIHDLDSLFHTGSFSGELRVVCLNFLQYLYVLPTFINIILVYAFCNLHDLTWGTKGIEKQAAPEDRRGEQDEQASDFKLWRTRILLVLLMANGAFGVYCKSSMDGACFLTNLAYTTGAYQALKLAASVFYILIHAATGRGSRHWQRHGPPVPFDLVDICVEGVEMDCTTAGSSTAAVPRLNAFDFVKAESVESVESVDSAEGKGWEPTTPAGSGGWEPATPAGSGARISAEEISLGVGVGADNLGATFKQPGWEHEGLRP